MTEKEQIRKATYEDLPRILEIYGIARAFMRENGNPTQWVNGYPSEDLLRADIQKDSLYVILRENRIQGVFYFAVEADPAYQRIEDGKWLSDAPYGVIHRIASAGSGGILSGALAFCKQRISHLRIDTHQDNGIMQNALEARGFRRCGIIYVEDGSPRIAYEQL